MRRLPLSLSSAAFAAAAFTFAPSAHAAGPVDVEIALRGGYASSPTAFGTYFAYNPQAGGLGARVGVSVHGVYGGINAIYYFGGDQSTLTTSNRAYTAMEGFDLGYTLTLGPLKLRPQLGIGNWTTTAAVNSSTTSASANATNNLYLEPGVVLLIPFGNLFVGADAGAILLPNFTTPSASSLSGTQSELVTSFAVHGQIGIRF